MAMQTGAFVRTRRTLALVLMFSGWVTASSAGAEQIRELPRALGKAELGMSLAKLRERYGAKLTPSPAAQSGGGLTVTVAEVPEEVIEPFGKCSVQFQFLNDQLYQVQARCDRPPSEIESALVKLYGTAHFKREEPVIWYWRNVDVTLIYSRALGQISLSDNRWAGTLFQRALNAPAPTTPSPAATP